MSMTVKNSNIKFRINKDDLEELQRQQKNFAEYMPKHKDALSTFVAMVIINTNAYLNNITCELQDSLKRVLKNSKYNEIGKEFVEKVKDIKSLENSLIVELCKCKLLSKYQYDDNEDNVVVEQFRPTLQTYQRLDAVIADNRSYDMAELFASLIHFFIGQSTEIKHEIMTGYIERTIRLAISQNHYVIINNMRIKPLLVCNFTMSVIKCGRYLFGIDGNNKPCTVFLADIFSCQDVGERFVQSASDDKLIKTFTESFDRKIDVKLDKTQYEELKQKVMPLRRFVATAEEDNVISGTIPYKDVCHLLRRTDIIQFNYVDEKLVDEINAFFKSIICYRIPGKHMQLSIDGTSVSMVVGDEDENKSIKELRNRNKT